MHHKYLECRKFSRQDQQCPMRYAKQRIPDRRNWPRAASSRGFWRHSLMRESVGVMEWWSNGAMVISDFGFRIEKINRKLEIPISNPKSAFPNRQSSCSNAPILQYSRIARYLYRQSHLALTWLEGQLAGTVITNGRCLLCGAILPQSSRYPRTNK